MGAEEEFKFTKLDKESTQNEIIEIINKFSTFVNENEICGDYQYEATCTQVEDIDVNESTIRKATKIHPRIKGKFSKTQQHQIEQVQQKIASKIKTKQNKTEMFLK